MQGASVRKNRNYAVTYPNRSTKIKQENFDFKKIVFIDYDIGFTQKNLDDLLSHDLHIVGGAYECHKRKGKIAAGNWNGKKGMPDYFDVSTIGLHECKWVGCGFLAIDSFVFKEMEYPYFESYKYIDGDEADLTSEDIGFCIKANDAGFKINVDCNIKLKHGEDPVEEKVGATDLSQLMQQKKPSVSIDQLRCQFNDHVLALQGIMKVTCENVIKSNTIINQKDQEISDLKKKIESLENKKQEKK